MSGGRLVGIILIVIGAVIAVLAGLWLLTEIGSGDLTSGGAILGAALAFLVLVAPLIGFGIFMVVQSRTEIKQKARAQQQRRLLDIVRSRGQVDIADLAMEMQVSTEEIRDTVHQLVGLQVFSGYVNWDKGTLYSAEAEKLRELKQCENCGGEIELSGKGVITCRFCGTEYLLT